MSPPSTWGKYKTSSGKSPMKEVGKAVLTIPVFTSNVVKRSKWQWRVSQLKMSKNGWFLTPQVGPEVDTPSQKMLICYDKKNNNFKRHFIMFMFMSNLTAIF
jgi:hypothetical protein